MTFRDGQYDVFNMFDKQWALATAGTVEDFEAAPSAGAVLAVSGD